MTWARLMGQAYVDGGLATMQTAPVVKMVECADEESMRARYIDQFGLIVPYPLKKPGVGRADTSVTRSARARIIGAILSVKIVRGGRCVRQRMDTAAANLNFAANWRCLPSAPKVRST